LESGVEVLVVTFEDTEQALNYQHEAKVEWPIVVDRNRELYGYFGMHKAGFWDLWGLSTWRAYFREILKGNLPKAAHDDIHQRGGDVLIDPEGMVRLHHIARGPADRPDIDEVIRIVEREQKSDQENDNYHSLKN